MKHGERCLFYFTYQFTVTECAGWVMRRCDVTELESAPPKGAIRHGVVHHGVIDSFCFVFLENLYEKHGNT